MASPNVAVRLALPVLSLLVLLAAVPGASAQGYGIRNPDTPTPTTLYLHVIDIQDMPINTQRPDDDWTVSNAVGLTTSTLSCTPETPGVNLRTPFHTYYGYSTPSYVEYAQEEGGLPRVHPERGISYDAHLDASVPFQLVWYMTTQSTGGLSGLPDPSQVPAPVPNVVVEATIRAGDAISVNDKAYNTGPILVHGKTPPATLLGPQVLPGVQGTSTTQPDAHVKALGQQPDGKWLYEFTVPMAIAQPVIPKDTGYNLRVDVFLDNPACGPGGDSALMPNTVRIHSDPQHRPRMELAVRNPIRIEALHPQFVGDELVVHASVNAVWGNYDVAEPSRYTPDVGPDDLRLTIAGPTDASSLVLVNLVSHTNPHYMHQDAVTIVYLWPYKLDHAVAGVYDVHLEASNDQGTATAVADSRFEIGRSGNSALNCTLGTECFTEGAPRGGGDDRGAPAPGLALVAALLVPALAWRRRR